MRTAQFHRHWRGQVFGRRVFVMPSSWIWLATTLILILGGLIRIAFDQFGGQ